MAFALTPALFALCAFGQSFTGSLRGAITDEKQAAIASARVTLRSESTGVERRAETNANGEYHFDSLAPGRYSLEVSVSVR
jgi:Carboxypeptidase regulatory-like domain